MTTASDVTEALVCPSCSTPDLAPDDLCDHRHPLCIVCCLGGEHHWWVPTDWNAA